MNTHIEVFFAPAEFEALKSRELGRACCVLFDILRATSTMVTALAHGARALRAVSDIPSALALQKESWPDALLAGERGGYRIGADLASGREFDLGNSPREFNRARVQGRRIVMTTTNGTRALAASAHAGSVFVGSFLNLTATAEAVRALRVATVFVVCSGTGEEVAWEDTLGAGALCELLMPDYGHGLVSDSVLVAQTAFRSIAGSSLSDALRMGVNGRRLMEKSDLRDDVAFCAQRDAFPLVAIQDVDGVIRTQPSFGGASPGDARN